uniref:BTB domain-containing protein n=1 Tax=Elaeophora elaphi TaxID=1147741 RepID=A0A0R3RRN6_9BILA
MASSKYDKGRKKNCILISNPKLIKVTMRSSKRILKLGDTEFTIYDPQMVATSNFLKRMLIGGNRKMIVLDDLKQKQPCFDATGLSIAISFAKGYAEVPLKQIISAIAAANALEMWDMRRAIIEQLCILAAQPESAPFAINIAVCNLEKEKAKYVVKHSSTIEKQKKLATAESAAKAIRFWCGNDHQRYAVDPF